MYFAKCKYGYKVNFSELAFLNIIYIFSMLYKNLKNKIEFVEKTKEHFKIYIFI